MDELFKEGTLLRDFLEMTITVLIFITPAYLLLRIFWSNREFTKNNRPRLVCLLLLVIPTAFLYLAISIPFWMAVYRAETISRLLLALKLMYIVVLIGLIVSLRSRLSRIGTAIALSSLNLTLLISLHFLLNEIKPRQPAKSGRYLIRLKQEDLEKLKAVEQKGKK